MPLYDRCQALIVTIPGTSNDHTSISNPRPTSVCSSKSHFSFELPSTSTFHKSKSASHIPVIEESRRHLFQAKELDDDGLSDIQLSYDEHPRHWSKAKKGCIAAFVLMAAFTATLGTPIYVAAIPAIMYEFHPLSITLAVLPSSTYAVSLGFSALTATSFSEIYGRLPILRITLPLSLLFTVLASTAPTYPYLLASKTLSGLFSGPALTVGVGILNDLWNIGLDPLGSKVAVGFVCTSVWATQVGPMASAALMEARPGEWGWTFHFCSVLLIPLVISAFLIPETHVPAIQRKLALKAGYRLPDRGTWKLLLKSVGRPLHMLIVEPVIFPTGLIMAVTQSVVFAYYVAYAMLFELVYGFTEYQVGMCFAPLLVGSVLALPVMLWFERKTYEPARRRAVQKGVEVLPEMRLFPAMLGAVLLPISLFWLAFSGRKSVHWLVPVLSGVPFGLAYVLNMLSLPLYTNAIYSTRYGASVLAASTFLRFAISSPFLLFTNHVVNKLGFMWAVCGMGFVAVALIPVPWAFWRWGPGLRKRSRYLRRSQGEIITRCVLRWSATRLGVGRDSI